MDYYWDRLPLVHVRVPVWVPVRVPVRVPVPFERRSRACAGDRSRPDTT